MNRLYYISTIYSQVNYILNYRYTSTIVISRFLIVIPKKSYRVYITITHLSAVYIHRRSMISHKHLALDLLPQRQERKAERKRLRERAEAWSIACYCVLLWVKYVFLVIPVFVFQGFVVFSNMLSWFDGVFCFLRLIFED